MELNEFKNEYKSECIDEWENFKSFSKGFTESASRMTMKRTGQFNEKNHFV